jgi:hypothetical protein
VEQHAAAVDARDAGARDQADGQPIAAYGQATGYALGARDREGSYRSTALTCRGERTNVADAGSSEGLGKEQLDEMRARTASGTAVALPLGIVATSAAAAPLVHGRFS